MLKTTCLTVAFLAILFSVKAQTVSDMINDVDSATIVQMVRNLSGEDPVIVGGAPATITHRVSNWGNNLAADYLLEQFSSYGLAVNDIQYSANGRNIVATKPGLVNPNDIYIICAHYDGVTYYGADDNASGSAAVLEAARIMANYDYENTVVFALWDEEEIGLIGANNYATTAAANNDNILGVLNMDMIGYNGDGDNVVDIDVQNIANSYAIRDSLISLISTHSLDLTPVVVDPGTTASDHSRFWNQGYSAVLMGEEWSDNDITPGYHNSNDRINLMNLSYFYEMTKLSVAYITTMAVPLVPPCATTYNTINPIVCDSYTSPSGNYTWTTSNSYQDTLVNTAGCDSVLTIDLTINYSNTGTDVITACDSYTWIDGNTYTSSNNSATYTLTNTAGCDSVVTLDLTINYSNTGIDVITACDSYTWIDGNTYTSSNNSATHTLTNTAGCDSVVTLDLTINYSNTGTDVITACDSYTWIDGNTYTSSNNSATHTLTNTAGCDSVVTLDLTINYSNTGTDVITACDSYTWIDGNTYTSSNNSATYTLTNTAGCDSVVTLDLTINYSNTGTDVISACDTYTWIDGNTYTSSNNSATHTLTNTAGCDSIVTLDLTINYSNTGTDVITACDSYTWIDGNTYTSSNNSATHTLTNNAGCDSVVTLDLTINSTPTATIVQSGQSITASPAGGQYQWFDCDNGYAQISGATNITFSPTSEGNYAAEVTLNGCTDTSNCLVFDFIGVDQLEEELFIIYPNPTTGEVTLSFNAPTAEVVIFDTQGKSVLETTIESQSVIDLSKFESGIYLFECTIEGKTTTTRVIKSE